MASLFYQGLREVEAKLAHLNIPFHLLRGDPKDTLPDLADALGAGLVVTDYSPLKLSKQWKKEVRLTEDVQARSGETYVGRTVVVNDGLRPLTPQIEQCWSKIELVCLRLSWSVSD
jgi:deoxyribodipyrimidine photolyase